MACHILGAPNMALHLSKRKVIGVECIKKEGASPFMFPKASVIRFDFAAYEDMPALKVFWYDGLKENAEDRRRARRRVARRSAVSARRAGRGGRAAAQRCRQPRGRRSGRGWRSGGRRRGGSAARRGNEFRSPGRVSTGRSSRR